MACREPRLSERRHRETVWCEGLRQRRRATKMARASQTVVKAESPMVALKRWQSVEVSLSRKKATV